MSWPVVLLQGGAGTGKSLFGRHMCHMWLRARLHSLPAKEEDTKEDDEDEQEEEEEEEDETLPRFPLFVSLPRSARISRVA